MDRRRRQNNGTILGALAKIFENLGNLVTAPVIGDIVSNGVVHHTIKAISLDRNFIGKAEKESDFDNIRESPEFQALIEEARSA